MKSTILSLFCLFAISSFAQVNTQEKNAQDTIKPKANALDEVKVYGNKKQFMKVEAGKTIVSVKDNPMLSSGNAMEAVKKMPGIISSPTGSLILNGKSVTIFIDGAPSTLTGNDLQNYLSSLPANAIEKVELIYNPGASFDANAGKLVK